MVIESMWEPFRSSVSICYVTLHLMGINPDGFQR